MRAFTGENGGCTAESRETRYLSSFRRRLAEFYISRRNTFSVGLPLTSPLSTDSISFFSPRAGVMAVDEKSRIFTRPRRNAALCSAKKIAQPILSALRYHGATTLIVRIFGIRWIQPGCLLAAVFSRAPHNGKMVRATFVSACCLDKTIRSFVAPPESNGENRVRFVYSQCRTTMGVKFSLMHVLNRRTESWTKEF